MIASLEGKLALVTGAGHGIGAALACGLARHGARIVVTDIDASSAAEVAERIRSLGGIASAYPLDVADPAACEAISRRVSSEAGPISTLVNNAGVCPRHTIDDPGVRRAWDAVMSINVTGALNVTLAFLPALRQTKGAIVNVASVAAFVATATSVGYSSSKAAVRLLTQSLAQELASDGVRVNCIAPGTIETAMTEPTRADPVRREKFLARIPMRRFGEPDELVGPVVFLASSMSSYVTGSTIVVDGGYLAA